MTALKSLKGQGAVSLVNHFRAVIGEEPIDAQKLPSSDANGLMEVRIGRLERENRRKRSTAENSQLAR